MPRRREPPHLWLKPPESKRARLAVWVIVDGARRESTGCSEHNIDEAQRKLAEYIKGKFEPPTGKGSDLLVVEAIAAYLEHHVAHLTSQKSREFGRDTCRPLLQWWAGKILAQVNGINCRSYVKWRCAQKYRGRKISDQTARHDLKSLRAALNWYKAEVDNGMIVPTVKMPSKAASRTDYYLTRTEVAARIRAARKSVRTHHVARMLLIGWYTGTRPGATLALRWIPTATAGWFDLTAAVLHRRGHGTKVTNKRQPPARIHTRLLPHLRRWHGLDMADGFTHVIRYLGEPVAKLRRSWGTVAKAAGAKGSDGPHIMRHSCCTWLMQAGVDVYEVSGFTGVSVKVLMEVYAHHHPAFQNNAATARARK
jgi:integrase